MSGAEKAPWYKTALRWGQTNLNEQDPLRYDAAFWREHWHKTRVQGVIVNAGGIVCFYPSRYPLHHRAPTLGDRDLFGEIVTAAKEEGLAVIARMDSCRTYEDAYRAQPDWFARDRDGKPYRSNDLYLACVNGPWFREYIPGILKEIIDLYHVDGFGDNSWSGTGQTQICYCDNCRRAFGEALPQAVNWDDPVYRRWIRWGYANRLEIWDLNNRVARAAGGEHCLWLGMTHGDPISQSHGFRDYREICRRTPIILLDSQTRGPRNAAYANSQAGKLIHEMLGWDKLIPESTATYQGGRPNFRHAAKPEAEVRLWAISGFAGGIQPWWHHIGSTQEDRRQFQTAEPLFRWHEEHQRYLTNRRPIASVGVVWSQQNFDFYGREDAYGRCGEPYSGWIDALIGERIPYLPLHADNLADAASRFRLLILPNLGSMTPTQLQSVRRFVEAGGHLIATGRTSRFSPDGEVLPDFALADLLGAHSTDDSVGSIESFDKVPWGATLRHNYLRLDADITRRHPILRGLDATDIIGFGGELPLVKPAPGAQVLATFVPDYPSSFPEGVWMRQPRSDIPAILANEIGKSRIVYMPADLDRCYTRDFLPDHRHLLANAVRWCLHDDLPLRVEGAGLFDCSLYEQPGRLILHMVNHSGPYAWRAPAEEFVPVGPLKVWIKTAGQIPSEVRLLCAGTKVKAEPLGDGIAFEIPRLVDHEVIVAG